MFLQYIEAGKNEHDKEEAQLRLPWITPRRQALGAKDTGRKMQNQMRVSAPELTRYSAANVAPSALQTSVPGVDNFVPDDAQVLGQYGLSPRYKMGCKACGAESNNTTVETRGRRGKVLVGEVTRLAPERRNLGSRAADSSAQLWRGDVGMDFVTWNMAMGVLATKGMQRDTSNLPFFTDKFTGSRVYVMQQLQRHHDRSLYDNKRNAPSRKSTAAPTTAAPTTRAGTGQGVSGLEPRQKTSSRLQSPLHQNLSGLKETLKIQHVSLDQRMRALVGLKKDALQHAAALAAQHRQTFEKQVEMEMLRLDTEILLVMERMIRCSEKLSCIDQSWQHLDHQPMRPSPEAHLPASPCSPPRFRGWADGTMKRNDTMHLDTLAHAVAAGGQDRWREELMDLQTMDLQTPVKPRGLSRLCSEASVGEQEAVTGQVAAVERLPSSHFVRADGERSGREAEASWHDLDQGRDRHESPLRQKTNGSAKSHVSAAAAAALMTSPLPQCRPTLRLQRTSLNKAVKKMMQQRQFKSVAEYMMVITLYLRNRGDSPLSDCGHELRQ